MKISLGFSPCPNDTFIFDALVHNKVDLEGLSFEVVMADVEALNQMAFEGQLDITKLSYHAFAHLLDQYVLLNAGSALGRNCGPLLVAKHPLSPEELIEGPIAIPGRFTTANFLLSLAYPQAQQKTEMLFSDIEQAVLDGTVQAGLIIHENRFTYQQKGLVKIRDLGEFWEDTTGKPIPLGGIVAKRSLPDEVKQSVDRVLARSVAFALDHPRSSLPFVRQYAQEMQEEVMYAHIGLYVNDFTRNLGKDGKDAVQTLFDMAFEKELLKPSALSVFL